jgi:hypothetical protein
MLADVVDPWPCPGRRANVRGTEERVELASYRFTRIRAAASPRSIPDQRTVRRRREATLSPSAEIRLQLALCVARQRQPPRLVELGRPNQERVLTRVVVADRQADELPATQAARVEQHDSQSEGLLA